MKIIKTLSLVLFIILLSPSDARGADLTCSTWQNSSNTTSYLCDTVSGMEKPGNCDLEGATQIRCERGAPNGYVCTGGACHLTTTCTASGSGYDCTLTVSGKLPNSCVSSAIGMHCNAVPAGYTLNTANNSSNNSSVVPLRTISVSGGGGGGGNSNLSYIPLEPIKGFTDGSGGVPDLPSLINGLFVLLFSIGGLLAVGRLVIGGIMYMTSEVVGKMDQAKKWMNSSFYGLFILAGAYLILYTINPSLLSLDFTVQTGIFANVAKTNNTSGQSNSSNNTTPQQNLRYSPYSSSSGQGQALIQNANFKAKGYTALIDVGGVGVVSVGNENLNDAKFIAFINTFSDGCWKAKGNLDVLDYAGGTAYFCGKK